jgi:hypothetical protein
MQWKITKYIYGGSGVLCGKMETLSSSEIAVASSLFLSRILLGLFFEGHSAFPINPHQTT